HRVTIDVQMTSARGDSVPFALTFANLLDDPTLAGIVVTGHDVSDRVAAEHALRQTNSLLVTTLEATADGVLVADEHGTISTFNRRFAEMWRIPETVAEPRNSDRALAYLLDQLEDPEAFLKVAREMNAPTEEHSHDILHFKDGRVLERFSRPRCVDGAVMG